MGVGEPSSPDLGLLDTLDDFGRMQPHKTSPSISPVTGSEVERLEILHSDLSPASALPHGRNGTGSWPPEDADEDQAALMSLACVDAELSVANKLEQLKSLMSDARVRQALHELRRENGR